VYRVVAPAVYACLKELNIVKMHLQAGRCLVMREKRNIFGMVTGMVLEEDIADLIHFYIRTKKSEKILSYIVEKAGLNIPGRGTAFAEEAQLIDPADIFLNEEPEIIPKATVKPQVNLVGITCIVQRGQGNAVACLALEMGTGVPSITFGIGMGVRDKIGLLRITIPAEKEVINIIVNQHEAEDLLSNMIEAGKLDQPGKGFIYLYPVRCGFVNLKIFRGKMRYAASMEQMIMAIDELKGSLTWRRKSEIMTKGSPAASRVFLKDLKGLTSECNEGFMMDLVNAAMAVGAAGATMKKSKFNTTTGEKIEEVRPAREMGYFIIGEQQAEPISNAIVSQFLEKEGITGIIELKEVGKAFTYLGRK